MVERLEALGRALWFIAVVSNADAYTESQNSRPFPGRPFLRLDCEASRARLRAMYERYGFQYHSGRRVGPYLVARYELRV